jgi:hypothetical protein
VRTFTAGSLRITLDMLEPSLFCESIVHIVRMRIELVAIDELRGVHGPPDGVQPVIARISEVRPSHGRSEKIDRVSPLIGGLSSV